MTAINIRWVQRLDSYLKALTQLTRYIEKGELTDLEKPGLIQTFEFTFELSWNLIKDFFEDQGETGIMGSRDAFRLAFRRNIITNGEVWMDMIESRTLTSHTYNEIIADNIVKKILSLYCTEFFALKATFQARVENLQ